MKTMKKTVSIVLSLLMLISLFAAVSFTADAATIDEINITEVFAPAELNSPDTTARVDSNNCKVDSIYWYNVTDSKWMESGESFTEGKVYEVNVHVKANDGSAFTTPDSVITATINGNAATVSHVTMEDPEEYLNFAYRFTATKANKKISSVVISGITEPVAGKYPVSTYDTGSSLYTVKAMEWRLPNDYILGGNTAFEPNSEYQARLYIYPGEGYQFGNNLTATINGHDAVVGQISGSSPIEFLCVKYNYTTGDLPSYTAPVTDDGIHRQIVSDVVNSKDKVETNSYMFYVPDEWKNEYNNYYNYNPDTKNFTDSGYFAAGIYWWDGPYNCNDNKGTFTTSSPGYAIVETVDGNPNIFRADVPKSVLSLEWNNLVDYGEDINNPLYAFSKRTESVNCEYYDKNDYTYGFYPDGVESFDGMIYVCNPYYKPQTEYSEKFFGGAWFYYYGNGEYGIYKTREEAEANNGVYKNGKFPKYEGMPEEITTAPTENTEPQETTAPIDEHSITNIGVVSVVEPEIGEKANSKAYARYGLPFNIQSVSWYNKTDGYMMMIDDDVFEADKTYTARVRVSAKSGYSFNNPTATINEKTANIIEEDGYEKEISLLVTRDFSTPAAKTDPEIITDVNITGVVEPVEAQAPSFAAFGEDKYFIESVTWFNCTDSVAIEAPETFEKGKEYAVNIFLRPHAGYRFNYDPKNIDKLDINAAVNGKTADSYMVSTGSGGKYIEIGCSFIATEAAVVETTAPAETTEPQETTTAPVETTVPQEVTTAPAETTVPQETTTAPVETTEPQETTSPVDPTHTHKWGGWTVTKQANMDEDGEETRECLDNPAHKETRVIAKVDTISGTYKYDYTGKKVRPSFTVKDADGKTLTEGVDYTVSYPNSVKVGLYVAEIAFSGKYEDLGYFEYSVGPLKNTVKATVKTKTVKLSKLKKKAQKVKAITVKNAKGKVTYKITSATKKIKKLVKISSKGVITFGKWKKAKKGTYKVKVKITAAGNSTYQSKSLSKIVKIKVK